MHHMQTAKNANEKILANNIASMYELQIVGNASIICFSREVVVCFLTSFPLFVFDATAKQKYT
jgi:hypothetical protein